MMIKTMIIKHTKGDYSSIRTRVELRALCVHQQQVQGGVQLDCDEILQASLLKAPAWAPDLAGELVFVFELEHRKYLNTETIKPWLNNIY